MRHLKAGNNLNRHPAHRRAMIRNMVMNLFEHGRIRTTIQKAKAARTLADKIITLAKKGTLHHRRLATEALGSTVAAKAAVRTAFTDLGQRFAERNGGYTRILKLPRTIRQAKVDLPRAEKANRSKYYGTRLGDNATMVLWELCEAEVQKREKPKRKKRRGLKRKEKETAEKAKAEEKAAEAPAEETVDEAETEGTKAEETVAEEATAEKTATEEAKAEEASAEDQVAGEAGEEKSQEGTAGEQADAEKKA
jgi:large subunit ribosomal protein L17